MTEPRNDDAPGQWQANMVRRVTALGYEGFIFGPGVNWWVIDANRHKVAGPFHSTDEFDAWLDSQEASRRPTPFTCPFCATFSYNPGDITHRYCARCCVFVDDVLSASPEARIAMARSCRKAAEFSNNSLSRDHLIRTAEVWEGKHDGPISTDRCHRHR